ncbi:glycosyltransferase family 2 protein [Bosea sp. PAMC 26642]|uniref:glycosyltransferase family 2 protein n=1 Tax=Bosea sp. (strain PAMC 26642) TaxID=1792307 RepID=UPI000770124C|nr:glycosyltransferase family 2 protein [Bosea sp. PAMC 26642]AMJ62693.1 hypothetical protein AXW83_22475 [Bosea sp. PAMC 26642]
MSAVSAAPLLSYIVLSYNYECYIGQTLRSIQEQSVQDFEIVVVDDASSDGSREVIRSFDDPRIRLFVNDRNMGGAWSYNRAVEAARGKWLVNLDADDWIAPGKAQVQLDLAQADHRLDIVGTYVNAVDVNGDPHPQRQEVEDYCNRRLNLNTVDTWVGQNPLCRSSTMILREAHIRIGLDDPTMVRAPDYELWTRALRHDCRFGVIPERLTYLRLTSSGVTHGDPVTTFLEMTYATLRNLYPVAEKRSLLLSVQRMIDWVSSHDFLSSLPRVEAHRLVGMMLTTPSMGNFQAFRQFLADRDNDPALMSIGQRCLAMSQRKTLNSDQVQDLMEARDFWFNNSKEWQIHSHSKDAAIEEIRQSLHSALDELSELKLFCENTKKRTLQWQARRLSALLSSRFSRLR